MTVLDDDDYPPYAPERPRSVYPQDHSPHWREVLVVVICAVISGLAIGGLIVAYGVF